MSISTSGPAEPSHPLRLRGASSKRGGACGIVLAESATETWHLQERSEQRMSEIIFEVTEDEVDRGYSASAARGIGVERLVAA